MFSMPRKVMSPSLKHSVHKRGFTSLTSESTAATCVACSSPSLLLPIKISFNADPSSKWSVAALRLRGVFCFGKQVNRAYGHGFIDGFAHVVDGEGGDGDGGKRFHFDASLSGDFGRSGDDDAIAGCGDFEIQFAMGNGKRV